MRNRQTSMICVSSKQVRDGGFQDFKINTWWREKALRTEKTNTKLRIGRGWGGMVGREFQRTPEARAKATLKSKAGILWMGGGEEPIALRTRNEAQVPAAAEEKPPRDAARLGSCCACAGGPAPGSSWWLAPPRPALDLGLALSSFACRQVRSPSRAPGRRGWGRG